MAYVGASVIGLLSRVLLFPWIVLFKVDHVIGKEGLISPRRISWEWGRLQLLLALLCLVNNVCLPLDYLQVEHRSASQTNPIRMGQPQPHILHGSSSRQRPSQIIIWVFGTVCLCIMTHFYQWPAWNSRTFPRPGVEGLGEEAGGRYHLLGTRMDSYIRILADFTTTSFPHDASSDLIQSLPRWLVHFDHRKSYKPSMTSFPTIHQTSANPLFVNGSGWMGNQTRLVEDEGWNRMIWDDRAISEWFERLFEKGRGDDPGVRQVWELLETSETRAKSFKYLIVLLEGALYMDETAYLLQPISLWGHAKPDIYDISSTDKSAWRRIVETTGPSVVLLIDVDIHKRAEWNQSTRSRPLQISSRVFSAAPRHPIFIDAVRRIVDLLRDPGEKDQDTWLVNDVDGRTDRTNGEVARERRSGDGLQEEKSRNSTSNSLTDSGILTDSALSYLLARYSVRWEDLRGIDRPLRIGEVLLLPTTSIAHGELLQGDPELDEQAVVLYGRQ